jgi:hypothetical protein
MKGEVNFLPYEAVQSHVKKISKKIFLECYKIYFDCAAIENVCVEFLYKCIAGEAFNYQFNLPIFMNDAVAFNPFGAAAFLNIILL